MRVPSIPAAVRHPVSSGVAVAALTLVISIPYLVAVHQFRYANGVVPSPTQVVRFALAVAVVAVLVTLAWRWRLHATTTVAAFGLVALPWLGPSSSAVDAGSGHLLLVVVALALVVEASVRRHPQVAALLDRAAVAVGLAHVLVGLLLQMTVRSLSFSPQWVVILMWAVILSAVALVLFATGALPVVLWRREHLVAPALAAAGWFTWGVSEIWRARKSLPLTDFQAIRWTVPQPHVDYAYQSTTLLLVLLVVAGLEFALREVAQAVTERNDVEEG